MSEHNDGGPAFPTDDYGQIGPTRWHHTGMTLRDYFAGQALANCFTNECNVQVEMRNDEYMYEIAACHCYSMADAMIAARGTQ